MKTDFERAKAITLKEYETVVKYYNETCDENGGREGGTENFAFRQQAYALQTVLKKAFGVIVDFQRRI